MTIGPDIKEAIVEVGAGFTIIRESGNVSGEYLTSKSNAQVTKPFIREFFLEGTMQYDTAVVSGDIIEFDTTGTRYLVTHITPTLFENSVIRYEVVLYMANVLVSILRPGERRDPSSYLIETYWDTIKSNVSLVLTTPLFGQSLEGDSELGLLNIETHEVYAPSSYGITYLDRLKILSTGEYWRVEAVRKYRYTGVDVIDVGEDVRPTTSTTTTSTTTTTA
jgi:hypothetical protein